MPDLHIVRFERIGTHTDVPDLVLTVDPSDMEGVAEQIHLYARGYLTLRGYETTLHEDGRVQIDLGPLRYGSGRVVTITREEPRA